MIRTALVTGVFALLVFHPIANCFGQGDGHAEEVFRACQHELEHLTIRCVNANRETAEICVRRIRELLKEGRIEAAIHMARHCIKRIEHQTEHCLREIHILCERCINRLIHLGAPHLARRFHENCRIAAHLVIHSARLAIEDIQNVFDPP